MCPLQGRSGAGLIVLVRMHAGPRSLYQTDG